MGNGSIPLHADVLTRHPQRVISLKLFLTCIEGVTDFLSCYIGMSNPRINQSTVDNLLLAITDHLHNHCTCKSRYELSEKCDACEVRETLRDIRDEVLALNAEQRRLATKRSDALSNALSLTTRTSKTCDECSALVALNNTLPSR